MKDLLKAQLTIGLLAFFATVWALSPQLNLTSNLVVGVARVLILFVVLIVLSYVLLALLEWINIYDLKTNSLLTLLVLITISITSTLL